MALNALPHIFPSHDTLVEFNSAFWSLMNSAFAFHEPTTDYFNQAWDWIENHTSFDSKNILI